MEYEVELKDPRDFTCEADYGNNQLRDSTGRGIWFEDLEDAKLACIEHEGFCVGNDEGDDVWFNPNYKSRSENRMRRFLAKKLMPKADDYERD